MNSEGWAFFVFFMVLVVSTLSVISYDIWSSHDLEIAKIAASCGGVK